MKSTGSSAWPPATDISHPAAPDRPDTQAQLSLFSSSGIHPKKSNFTIRPTNPEH